MTTVRSERRSASRRLILTAPRKSGRCGGSPLAGNRTPTNVRTNMHQYGVGRALEFTFIASHLSGLRLFKSNNHCTIRLTLHLHSCTSEFKHRTNNANIFANSSFLSPGILRYLPTNPWPCNLPPGNGGPSSSHRVSHEGKVAQ